MNDLISRQAAIDAIVAWTVEDRPDIEMPTDLVGRINAMPPAQPERKRGQWIGGEIGRCSVCGHEGCASDIWNNCERKFCPNCGAEMKGGRE